MSAFGKKSLANLATCHPDIQRVLYAAIIITDFSVIYGFRGKTIQDEAYQGGFSTKPWPTSKHNKEPSLAVDLIPYPSGWPQEDDSEQTKLHKIAHFYYMAGVIMTIAAELGVKLRWGGDWDMDKSFLDQKFDDLAHFELVEG